MLCISRQWLELVAPGLTLASRPGLFVSSIFSFGGGGAGGEDTAELETEDTPRTLVLVGMADRYEVGGHRAASVITLCVDTTGLGVRLPSQSERVALIDQLQLLSTQSLQNEDPRGAQVIELIRLLEAP